MKFPILSFLTICLIWASLDASSEAETSIGSRVLGGNPVTPRQYKFVAAITVHTATTRFFCGGSLLSTEWILTAGQCVYDALSFTIHLGSTLLEGDDDNRLTVTASQYVLNPDFSPQTLHHDVGLIKLSTPIEFTDFIQPTQHLALAPLQDSDTVNAMGWGQVNDDSAVITNELYAVRVKSIAHAECQLTFGTQINEHMVCIDGKENEAACIGDSGGALIQVVSRSRQVHVGIASFISGNGCRSTDPSGYTRTWSYIDWIRTTTDIWNTTLS